MKITRLATIAAFAAATTQFAGCFDGQEAPRVPPEARSAEALSALSPADRGKLERLLLRGRANEAMLSKEGFFAGLDALRELDISGTGVKAVPAPVAEGALPALEHLYLADNPALSALPGALFAKNPKLTYLNLDRSGVKSLPEELGDAKEIRWLRLNSTGTEALPQSLAKLEKLQRLYARDCKLKEIPPQLKGMKALEDIALDGNAAISEFPDWVAELPAIKNISLDGTKVAKLPQDLKPLRKLSTLSLVGCPVPMDERHRISEALPRVSIQY